MLKISKNRRGKWHTFETVEELIKFVKSEKWQEFFFSENIRGKRVLKAIAGDFRFEEDIGTIRAGDLFPVQDMYPKMAFVDLAKEEFGKIRKSELLFYDRHPEEIKFVFESDIVAMAIKRKVDFFSIWNDKGLDETFYAIGKTLKNKIKLRSGNVLEAGKTVNKSQKEIRRTINADGFSKPRKNIGGFLMVHETKIRYERIQKVYNL